MTMRHKVFVSYHHANDEAYKARFEERFSKQTEAIISRSVQIGDIDPTNATETIRQTIRDSYLSDSTVTVVLVGSQTWQRKHVDWEIYSSLRDTKVNPRSGLVGILLPTYTQPNPNKFDPYTIPPRLYDNQQVGFGKIYTWSEDAAVIQGWIHEAFLRRNQDPSPNLARPLFANNRSGDRWSS